MLALRGSVSPRNIERECHPEPLPGIRMLFGFGCRPTVRLGLAFRKDFRKGMFMTQETESQQGAVSQAAAPQGDSQQAAALKQQLQQQIAHAAQQVRTTNPMAGSITNTVTVNFVANAQIAVGGSAAMVYLPDEGEFLASAGNATYINVGTLFPIYEETLPRTARALHEQGKQWVLDPVGIGIGGLRSKLLSQMKECKPTIIRGNASEIIALATLWGLDAQASAEVRGVDSTQAVDEARSAAVALARYTGGAVAVSGETDLVTDGNLVCYSHGGSHFMAKITGSGCSLGGVCAVYATCAETPLAAAMAGVQVYNLAGARAEAQVEAPASFQVAFIDELYKATPEDIAANPFDIEVL